MLPPLDLRETAFFTYPPGEDCQRQPLRSEGSHSCWTGAERQRERLDLNKSLSHALPCAFPPQPRRAHGLLLYFRGTSLFVPGTFEESLQFCLWLPLATAVACPCPPPSPLFVFLARDWVIYRLQKPPRLTPPRLSRSLVTASTTPWSAGCRRLPSVCRQAFFHRQRL